MDFEAVLTAEDDCGRQELAGESGRQNCSCSGPHILIARHNHCMAFFCQHSLRHMLKLNAGFIDVKHCVEGLFGGGAAEKVFRTCDCKVC